MQEFILLSQNRSITLCTRTIPLILSDKVWPSAMTHRGRIHKLSSSCFLLICGERVALGARGHWETRNSMKKCTRWTSYCSTTRGRGVKIQRKWSLLWETLKSETQSRPACWCKAFLFLLCSGCFSSVSFLIGSQRRPGKTVFRSSHRPEIFWCTDDQKLN